MTVLAVVSTVVSFAVRGQEWALAICTALGMLILVFCVYAATFLLTLPMSLIEATLRSHRPPTTPFATSQPPPQILPPMEPE